MSSHAERREKVVKKRIEAAEKGDDLSGRAILQGAAVALYLITENKPIDRGDIEVLRFIHRAFRFYLDDGISIDKALCIANEIKGRPRKVDTSIFLVLAMDRELDKQLKRGDEFIVERAMDRVSKREGASISAVDKAWLRYEGKKGYEKRKELSKSTIK